MNKWAIGIVGGVLLLAALVYALYEEHDYDFDESQKSYEIIQKWNVPNILDEISGLVWLGDNKLACVQDEEGIIFVYDLNSSKIIHQTQFTGPGDYEGLARLEEEFWVAESDGKLFRVSSLESEEIDSEERKTGFEYKNNVEGITPTTDGKLLISVKDRNLEKDEGAFKAIYSYDPKTGRLAKDPAYKIKYDDPAFSTLRIDNPEKFIRPSDLTFSPDGELYVLDAEIQKILILDSSGDIKRLILLDPAEFFQPEGICFSPSGRMFISNEGKGGDPNIVEVRLK